MLTARNSITRMQNAVNAARIAPLVSVRLRSIAQPPAIAASHALLGALVDGVVCELELVQLLLQLTEYTDQKYWPLDGSWSENEVLRLGKTSRIAVRYCAMLVRILLLWSRNALRLTRVVGSALRVLCRLPPSPVMSTSRFWRSVSACCTVPPIDCS